MKKHKTSAHEWSFIIMADDVADTPKRYAFVADHAVCAALCNRFGVLDLQNVRAEISISRVQGGDIILVEGTVFAHVTQACVVTLAPVEADVTDTFKAYFTQKAVVVPFARAGDPADEESGTEILDEENAPEVMVDGQIDVGEVAAQFLSLAIPAYPRAADAPAVFTAEGAAEGGDVQPKEKENQLRDNPFAALKEWKEGL